MGSVVEMSSLPFSPIYLEKLCSLFHSSINVLFKREILCFAKGERSLMLISHMPNTYQLLPLPQFDEPTLIYGGIIR